MKPKLHLLLALLVLSGCALLLAMYWKLSLELTFLALAAAGSAIYLAIRFPEWFLVAALFAPQWKTIWVLRPLGQYADITVIILLCLVGGLAWRFLMWFGRIGYEQITSAFSSQAGSILAFFVFAAFVTASYSYTNAPLYGGSKLLRFLLIGTILFVSPLLIIFTEDDFRKFTRLFVGFSAATAIELIGTLELRSQTAEDDITRIGAGWLMGMAILLLLFYPLSQSRGRQRALLIFLLPLLFAGLMASAARGPIIALSMAVLLGAVVWMKIGRLRVTTAAFFLLFFLFGIGGAYFVLRQTDPDKYTAKAGELELLFTRGSSSGSAGKRIAFYRATLSAIPNQPLLGTGIGSWATFYYGNDDRNYPHDLILEIAYEEGLVGLTAFLSLLGIVGFSIYRMLRASRSHFLVLCLLVLYCVVVSLFSGDLDDNRILWLWIGVALAVGSMVQSRVSAWNKLYAQRMTIGGVPAGAPQRGSHLPFPRPLGSERYSMKRGIARG